MFPVLAEARRPATRQRGGASHPQVARTPSDASDLLVRLEDVRRLRQRAAAPRGEARRLRQDRPACGCRAPVASARSETLVDKAMRSGAAVVLSAAIAFAAPDAAFAGLNKKGNSQDAYADMMRQMEEQRCALPAPFP